MLLRALRCSPKVLGLVNIATLDNMVSGNRIELFPFGYEPNMQPLHSPELLIMAVHLTPFTTAASGTPLSDIGLPNAQSAS